MSRRPPPPVVRGVLVGALHGATEWLPVSSSGHVALLIDLGRWPEADPSRRRERRALEVALHTGSLLPIAARVLADLRAAPSPAALAAAGVAATGLTALVGGTFGPAVERRFAGPRSVAAGLLAGSLALVAAERSARRAGRGPRSAPGPRDALAVGLAQGVAICPGVSRRAATLAAARVRGLDPEAASALSWAAGLPTLLAATLWQFHRSAPELRAAPSAPLAGALASAAAGVASRSLPARTAGWPAATWALWRLLLASATLRRGRERLQGGGPGPGPRDPARWGR